MYHNVVKGYTTTIYSVNSSKEPSVRKTPDYLFKSFLTVYLCIPYSCHQLWFQYLCIPVSTTKLVLYLHCSVYFGASCTKATSFLVQVVSYSIFVDEQVISQNLTSEVVHSNVIYDIATLSTLVGLSPSSLYQKLNP